MTKIEFKNLPDTTTPLSADNLNTLQDNVENAINSIEIELDDTVSTSSTNGVENQAITNYVDSKISNTAGTSQTVGYSQSYINGKVNAENWVPLNNWLAYKKCGDIVCIRGYSRNAKTLAANNYTLLGTLPEGYRPSYELLSLWTTIGVNQTGLLQIGTDGKVSAYSESDKAYWGFTVTFIV